VLKISVGDDRLQRRSAFEPRRAGGAELAIELPSQNLTLPFTSAMGRVKSCPQEPSAFAIGLMR
jgi:hypothetical protein